MMAVYVGLGSNIGSPAENLRRAIALIAADDRIRVSAVSPFYKTDPLGVKDQSAFVNAVCQIETGYAPNELFFVLKRIERDMGRVPTVRYGPRIIDLDILLFGADVFQGAALTVPHPRLAERSFVLYPLCDIAPDLVHPLTGRRICALKNALTDDLGIKRLAGPPDRGTKEV